MPINRSMSKWKVVHPYNELLLGNEMEQTGTCDNMYQAESEKPTQDYILYVLKNAN